MTFFFNLHSKSDSNAALIFWFNHKSFFLSVASFHLRQISTSNTPFVLLMNISYVFYILLNSCLQRLGLVRELVPGVSAPSLHSDTDTPRLILFDGNSVKRENRLALQDEITEITDWVQITRENSLASLCAGTGGWLKKKKHDFSIFSSVFNSQWN